MIDKDGYYRDENGDTWVTVKKAASLIDFFHCTDSLYRWGMSGERGVVRKVTRTGRVLLRLDTVKALLGQAQNT